MTTDNFPAGGPALYKAHATENDFVMVIDPDGRYDLDIPTVQFLCDRQAGIGGDGLIRIISTAAAEQACGLGPNHRLRGQWFMDYRNTDGSIAEMCGNGVRAFVATGLGAGVFSLPVGGELVVATRGGDKPVSRVAGEVESYRVGTGWPAIRGQVLVRLDGRDYVGNYYHCPNPHIVIEVGSEAELAAIKLPQTPAQMHDFQFQPVPENGANVEFVAPLGPDAVRMRVAERGVGETRSCGTGCVAVGFDRYVRASEAEVFHPHQVTEFSDGGVGTGPANGLAARTWKINIPGGQTQVSVDPRHYLTHLAGPAQVVAQIQLRNPGLIRPHACTS